MSVLVAAAAALSLYLIFTGLPVWDRTSVSARVDPYIGLGGRLTSPRLIRVFRSGRSASSELRERLQRVDRGLDEQSFRLQQLAWSAWGVLGSGGLVILMTALGGAPRHASVPVILALGAAIGYAGRDRCLSAEIARRNQRIVSDLPVAIDLLTLSLIAGETIPSAFARVGRVLPGPLGREMERVVADTRAGIPITEALDGAARRIDEPAVWRLTDALCVALDRGAPVAEVLSSQSDDLRADGHRRLLESGGRREIWMLVPVVFLILPVIVAFVLLPGLVSLDLLVP